MRVNKKVLTIILTVYAVIFALFESNSRSTRVEITVDEKTAYL